MSGYGKRRLRNRSKYDPHQSAREMMRRVGQMLRRGDTTDPAVFDNYIDYATAKAAGQDLTRFQPIHLHGHGPEPTEYANLDEVLGPARTETIGYVQPIGDDYDGLMDAVAEGGQD